MFAIRDVGRVGRSYLRLADEELARLLLGQSDPLEAAASGRLESSTQVAQKLATQLFPRVPLWCPMWDDIPARPAARGANRPSPRRGSTIPSRESSS